MILRQWTRERWKELRWGLGVYLSSVVTLINLILLISIRFNIYGDNFLWLVGILFLGLTSLGIFLGHLHRIWQQDTDALLENKAVIQDIVKRMIEEMKKNGKKD